MTNYIDGRTQGEWITVCTLPIIRKCSLCGVEQTSFYDNYCPYCGAKMKKPQTQKFADNDTAYSGLASAT